MTDPITHQDFAWGIMSGDLKKSHYGTKKTLETLLTNFFPRKEAQDFGKEACEKCFIDKKLIIFEPCGHFRFCSSCALKTRNVRFATRKLKHENRREDHLHALNATQQRISRLVTVPF